MAQLSLFPTAVWRKSACYHIVMSTNKASVAAVNTFGTLGYLSTILQWTWSTILVGFPLLSSDKLSFLIPKPSDQPPPKPMEFGVFDPVVTIIAIIFTVIIVIATIYALVRLPSTVGKRGQHITQHTAQLIAPTIIHKPISKKKRAWLTLQFTWGVKLGLVLLPVFALYFASPEAGLDPRIQIYVGLFCAAGSLLYFAIQWVLQRIFSVAPERVW